VNLGVHLTLTRWTPGFTTLCRPDSERYRGFGGQPAGRSGAGAVGMVPYRGMRATSGEVPAFVSMVVFVLVLARARPGLNATGLVGSAAGQLIEPVEHFGQAVAHDDGLAVGLWYAGLPGAELARSDDHGRVRGAEPGQAYYLVCLVGHDAQHQPRQVAHAGTAGAAHDHLLPSRDAYTATTLAWIGDPAAERYARHVLARLESTVDGPPRPRRAASARLDLSLALIAAGRHDEAAGTALEAVTSGRLVPSNYWRAREVIQAVAERGVPEAAELPEAYGKPAGTASARRYHDGLKSPILRRISPAAPRSARSADAMSPLRLLVTL
jgi:hypothetical protein